MTEHQTPAEAEGSKALSPLSDEDFANDLMQMLKGRSMSCLVCWKAPCDPAHLIDRSLWPDPGHQPIRVVSLCREHHRDYDEGRLDLLPYLKNSPELAYAVLRYGLLRTLERVTNTRWEPMR